MFAPILCHKNKVHHIYALYFADIYNMLCPIISPHLHHHSRKANFAAPCTFRAGCLHQRLRLLFRSQSPVSLLRSRSVRSALRPLPLPRENFARGAAPPQNQGRTLRPFCVSRTSVAYDVVRSLALALKRTQITPPPAFEHMFAMTLRRSISRGSLPCRLHKNPKDTDFAVSFGFWWRINEIKRNTILR